MSADTVDWLKGEIRDLLDVSPVGLYEFIWMLNTPERAVSIEDRKLVARRALDELVKEPGVHLIWMRWPDWTRHGTITLGQLPVDPWSEPEVDGLYLALDRFS